MATSLMERARTAIGNRAAGAERHRAEKDAAYDNVLAARKVIADLADKFTAANKANLDAEEKRSKAALASLNDPEADKEYEKQTRIAAECAALKEKISVAQVAAQSALAEAERNWKSVSRKDQVNLLARQNADMLKAVTEYADAIQLAYKAHAKICEINRRRQAAWTGPMVPTGSFMFDAEILTAEENELFRVSGRPFIQAGVRNTQAPALPGARPTWQAGQNAAAIPPMVDRIAEANKFLLSTLDETPLPSPEPIVEVIPEHRKPKPIVVAPAEGDTVGVAIAVAPARPKQGPTQLGEVVAVPSRKGQVS